MSALPTPIRGLDYEQYDLGRDATVGSSDYDTRVLIPVPVDGPLRIEQDLGTAHEVIFLTSRQADVLLAVIQRWKRAPVKSGARR